MAADRRFPNDGGALQRPENDPKLYRLETYAGCRRFSLSLSLSLSLCRRIM